MAKPNKQKPRPTTVSQQDREDDAKALVAPAADGKTTAMTFREDKFYNGELIYTKGEVHQVPNEMIQRWLNRGGAIVGPGEEKPVELPPEPLEPEKEKVEDPKFVDPQGEDDDSF